MQSTLITCISHSVCGDQRIGYEVYEILRQRALPEGARLEFLSVGGLNILDDINGEEQLIVVDAANTGAAPGTVHVLPWQQIEVLDKQLVSLLEVGLGEVMRIGQALYPERMPKTALQISVEGKVWDRFDVEISGEVRAGISRAADEVIRHCG